MRGYDQDACIDHLPAGDDAEYDHTCDELGWMAINGVVTTTSTLATASASGTAAE